MRRAAAEILGEGCMHLKGANRGNLRRAGGNVGTDEVTLVDDVQGVGRAPQVEC